MSSKPPMGRRQFLRLLATAGAAAVLPAPMRALGASRPALDLIFPQDPFETWFAPTFGMAKPDGRIHMGIDLMAPKLSPVYAIADGTVSRIGQSPRAGRHLIIDHADGWQSWYLHLNNDDPGRNNGRAAWDITVFDGIEEGSVVTGGSQVAFVGNSGNAEGGMSHTHFELHLGRRILNPYRYLVEGQEVALEHAIKKRIAELGEQKCHPAGNAAAIDPWACPAPPTVYPRFKRGVSGAV